MIWTENHPSPWIIFNQKRLYLYESLSNQTEDHGRWCDEAVVNRADPEWGRATYPGNVRGEWGFGGRYQPRRSSDYPSTAGSGMTMKELIAEIEEADAEIDRGEFLTSEELEKEMEQW